MERCGGGGGGDESLETFPPGPHPWPRCASLTALLDHVAAALAQGYDVMPCEHARTVRFFAAACAQGLPAGVAEVRGLCILRTESWLRPEF